VTFVSELALGLAVLLGAEAGPLPFAPGERMEMELRYASLLAGRAHVRIDRGLEAGRPVLRFVLEARSEGSFARLLNYRVRDRSRATWEPESGCSLGIEKRLREGRATRDQVVRIDPDAGTARVEDAKIDEALFDVGPCTLDVLSALFVTRIRGVPEAGSLSLPVFDNGKRYLLEVRYLGRESLDLPEPFGPGTPTVVVEPLLAEGTGLFVKEGRLKVWLTDDARRVPVRMASKVPIGSVIAEIVAYSPGTGPTP